MAQVEMRVDLSRLVNALIANNPDEIIAASREQLQNTDNPDTLLGRIGMIAVRGDHEGHPSITLAAAAMLSRWARFMPAPVDSNVPARERVLPLFVQAVRQAAAAVRAGNDVQPQYPEPFFPSELPEGETVNTMMHKAVHSDDTQLAERLLFGLYGSGADYRTMEVRAYEGIADTFQNNGHQQQFALRGFQLLDAVEWGDRAPNVLHWLAPHLPLKPQNDEPEWAKQVRDFANKPENSLAAVRTRLAPPKEESALALRQTLRSDVDTIQVCRAVNEAIIKGGASPRATASVIALAAADLLNTIGDEDRALFIRAAHGLLLAAAVRQIFTRVQDVEAMKLVYLSAAYINALHKELAPQAQPAAPKEAAAKIVGGGFIAGSQLETLQKQLVEGDYSGALTTARRYLKIGHDPRALFAAVGIAAGYTDANADQGHTLQIVQAAAEEFVGWPRQLQETDRDSFIQAALRAAAFGPRDSSLAGL
ncbi:hypothetical protein EI42_01613 [Thermosporothrix hazakensis]|jgi:hypothetical protein|uniref:Uncharacterized protein n=2 Tax=Thermosporothrix TaxID=768650 RepID=A0A326UL49_THEHA|nr:hypothetical protein [Thermosporothrix hazakensis]PZW33063.1 hypothetical protein EI42_01613 [Thermosporothrix hazakensis]BBH91042.1 hypothetical protein KTC_57930 [Thermosporothrix sp. COM3]GCE49095.1 hypothetical protein KTH_39640 [Thermosporothrix hazakensis]